MIHQKLHAMNIVITLVRNLFRRIVAYICSCLGRCYKNIDYDMKQDISIDKYC